MLIFFMTAPWNISYFYFMMQDRVVPSWCVSSGVAMLVDPDVGHPDSWEKLSFRAKDCGVKLILVGGSFLHTNQLVSCIESCKKSGLPVWIFPGSGHQICTSADGILLLSLLSGRNPDLLIGQHVVHARALRDSGLPHLPTAYLLIDGGKCTTVSYISNTTPIPRDKPQLAAATALAGEQLGMTMVYMDAGSGADFPISTEMIQAVRQETAIPMMVGGGIRSVAQVQQALKAGANWVVIGSQIEHAPEFLNELKQIKF
jgi:phosphoglycerol geranylgeranyltransferase